MAETSSNENEKPVAPASKKPSKKDEPKDTKVVANVCCYCGSINDIRWHST